MKILFIYNGLPIGGIETFLVRLARQFKNNNHTIRILFYTNIYDKQLLSELSEYAEIFYWDDYIYKFSYTKKIYPLFKILFPLKQKKVKREILDGITHIHAPDSYSMLFSRKLLKIDYTIKITTGVYQINEYNIDKYLNYSFARYIKKFLNLIPPQNMIFFNEISKDFYSSKYEGKFLNSSLTPIGIDLDKYNKSILGFQNNRIVSVGRLVNWKTYNYAMIKVVNDMQTKGINIRYESYGDGNLMDDLKALIKKEGLEQNIFFYKNIPYEEFKDKISNSLMFIGSGTSLIEASACGIPALIGIENEFKSITYGFLHDTKTYSYHEKSLNYPTFKIESMINKLMHLTAEEYNLQCLNAQKRANDFKIEKSYKGFMKMFNNSTVWSFRSRYYFNYLFLYSLVLHFFVSKITKTYDKSFFNRFSIEDFDK